MQGCHQPVPVRSLALPTALPTAPSASAPWAHYPCGGGTHVSSRASKPGEGRGGAEGTHPSRGGGARAGSLLALEEDGPSVLACPGGKWSVHSCLPGRRVEGCESCLPGRKVVRASLLAREESGPCVLACPGGKSGCYVLCSCLPWRKVVRASLLALEESGPCFFSIYLGNKACYCLDPLSEF